MDTAKFPIGTRYTSRGRTPTQEHTVIDILSTYNAAGELVRTRYVTQHTFCGQIITNRDVLETSIARGNPIIPA